MSRNPRGSRTQTQNVQTVEEVINEATRDIPGGTLYFGTTPARPRTRTRTFGEPSIYDVIRDNSRITDEGVVYIDESPVIQKQLERQVREQFTPVDKQQDLIDDYILYEDLTRTNFENKQIRSIEEEIGNVKNINKDGPSFREYMEFFGGSLNDVAGYLSTRRGAPPPAPGPGPSPPYTARPPAPPYTRGEPPEYSPPLDNPPAYAPNQRVAAGSGGGDRMFQYTLLRDIANKKREIELAKRTKVKHVDPINIFAQSREVRLLKQNILQAQLENGPLYGAARLNNRNMENTKRVLVDMSLRHIPTRGVAMIQPMNSISFDMDVGYP